MAVTRALATPQGKVEEGQAISHLFFTRSLLHLPLNVFSRGLLLNGRQSIALQLLHARIALFGVLDIIQRFFSQLKFSRLLSG